MNQREPMSYQQKFKGDLTFRSGHHMEAGLDALSAFHEEYPDESIVQVGSFTRPTARRLSLDLDLFAPASKFDDTISCLYAIAEHASGGCIRASYHADGVSRRRVDAEGPSSEELPARHYGYDLWFSVLQGDEKGVTRALERGADPNFQPAGEPTVLMQAIQDDHLALARLLLEAGADPLGHLYGDTAFHMVCSAEGVDLMLEQGLEPDVFISQEHRTPLVEALRGEHREAVLRLLERGASVAHERVTQSALEYGARHGWIEVAAAVRAQVDPLPHQVLDLALRRALRAGHDRYARWCIDHGAVLPDDAKPALREALDRLG